MEKAKNGDTVAVNYTGKLTGGEVFDTSEGRDPLEFQVGAGQVIPGFDQAVVGMKPGESKEVTVPPEQAYGKHSDEKVVRVERSNFPPDVELKVGQRLAFRDDKNQEIQLTVTELSDSAVTLDGNHPLAGKDLTFDIELVKIASAGG